MIQTKQAKSVLIVEDDRRSATMLADAMSSNSAGSDSPYLFQPQIAATVGECIERLTTQTFDVVVLDVALPEGREGLEVSLTLALSEEFGPDRPVRIVVTSRESYADCVEAVRSGAWDYIPKIFLPNVTYERQVFNSATAALRLQDTRAAHAQVIGREWVPGHLAELQREYGKPRYVALWHLPTVTVVAEGGDAFELETNLRPWRAGRPIWEEPYVMRIPAAPSE